MSSRASHDGRHDFDFVVGDWNVRNLCMTEPGTGSVVWEEFGATARVRPVLYRLGFVDEFNFGAPKDQVKLFTLCLFNPTSRQWYIHRASNADGELQDPLVGEFDDGVGEFYAHELVHGQRVFCRQMWSDITPTSFRWEQAYSTDGGETWQTNWTMFRTRVRRTTGFGETALIAERERELVGAH